MNKRSVYDVIVIGCGPAGNTLAYELARQGVNVLMIEKAKLPRDKICAGGLSRKTVEKIGYAVDDIIEKEITGSYLTYKNEIFIHKYMPGVCCVVRRDRFDHFMTKKAVEAGAHLLQQASFIEYREHADFVAVNTTKGNFRTRILVGADGVFSKVRKAMHPTKKAFLGHTIEALVYPQNGLLESFGPNTMLDFGGIPGGYGWIFPKRDHFNVGLFKIRDMQNNRNMKKLLYEFISRNRVLRDHKWLEIRACPIPLKPVSRHLAFGRVLLIGDAAGFGESFYGEGIYFAVLSADLACDAIQNYLQKGASLKMYNGKIKLISRNLMFSRLTARLFYQVPRFGFYHMVRNKWVNYYFSQLIYGKVSHTRCFMETLLFSPLWMFSPKFRTIEDSHLK